MKKTYHKNCQKITELQFGWHVEKLVFEQGFQSGSAMASTGQYPSGGWMDGWLAFNGILSTQVAAISCLKTFKVC